MGRDKVGFKCAEVIIVDNALFDLDADEHLDILWVLRPGSKAKDWTILYGLERNLESRVFRREGNRPSFQLRFLLSPLR